MSREKGKKKPISEEVSALASLAQNTGASDEDYKLESVYLDQLRQQLIFEKEQHELQEQKERHKLRKAVLRLLFGLTLGWLIVVVIFVGWTALSPSVQDREKLFQLQTQAGLASSSQTNSPPKSVLNAVAPSYCPILFHLSDSVLVAFITSTTVAVLGLFLTAAKWLYSTPNGEKLKPGGDSASKRKSG